MTQTTQESSADAPASTAEQSMVVVRLGEITLKKKNRPFFVRRLGRNIRRAARGMDVRDVELGPNRILITP